MQTRSSLDLSCNKTMITRFSLLYLDISKKYETIKNEISIIKRLKLINSIFSCSLKHMNMLLKIANMNYDISIERYFKSILMKKKDLKKQIDEYSLDPEIDNPQFKLYSKLLLNKMDKLSVYINDYFTRKYIFVLMRTNKDVYSNILSYI